MVNFVILIFTGLFAEIKEEENTGGFAIDQRGRYVAYFEEDRQHIEGEDLNLAEHIGRFFRAEVRREDENEWKRVILTGKATLKKHVDVGNYIAGEVCYNLIFEKTAAGYRYWFTDLAYKPYIKDRYGKVVAAEVKPIPLEKKSSKINQRAWFKQREFAYYTINKLSADFNTYLKRTNEPEILVLP